MEDPYMMQKRFNEYKRKKRKDAIVETFAAIGIVALIAFAVKLWFVAEGFTIQW